MNPGYGMATLIHKFWDYFSSLQGSSTELLGISKTVSRIPSFLIKYYYNIRANFPLYFNVNVYTATIFHYLNN